MRDRLERTLAVLRWTSIVPLAILIYFAVVTGGMVVVIIASQFLQERVAWFNYSWVELIEKIAGLALCCLASCMAVIAGCRVAPNKKNLAVHVVAGLAALLNALWLVSTVIDHRVLNRITTVMMQPTLMHVTPYAIASLVGVWLAAHSLRKKLEPRKVVVCPGD
jgi:hypothetical protein